MLTPRIRLRPSWRSGWWVWLALVGLLLALVAFTIDATHASNDRLSRLADQAQLVGVVITVAGAAITTAARLQQRLQPDTPPDAARVLAEQVWQVEQRARWALLGDTTAATVPFAIPIRERDQHGNPPQGGSLVDRVLRLVRYRPEQPGPDGDLRSIAEFYNGLEATRLVVLGEPGSGKTVLAIELIVQLLTPHRRDQTTPRLVPVRASLAGWDTTRPFEDWLAERLTIDYQLRFDSAQRLVNEGRVLPVLDGLDEMDPDPAPGHPAAGAPRATEAIDHLNRYTEGAERAAVVITCRQHRWAQLEQHSSILRGATRIRLLPLEIGQIRDYITDRFADDTVRLAAWQDVLDGLGEPAAVAARAALSTPWRLHLASVLVQAGRDPTQLLHAGVGEDPVAAARRIDRLLLEGYVPAATELATVQQLAVRYDQAKVARWLGRLAAHLDWQAAQAHTMTHPPAGLSAVDLVPHLLWAIGGWRRIRYLHAATGFVLGAVGTAAFAVALIGPSAVWLDKVQRWFADLGVAPWPYVIGQLLSASAGLVVPLLVAQRCLEPWPSPRAAARKVVSVRDRLGGFAGGLVVGLTGGLGVGLVLGLSRGFVFGLVSGLAFALVAGLAGGLMGGFEEGFARWGEDITVASPYSPLRMDLMATTVFSLAGGLVFALVFGLVDELAVGLAGGLVLGLVFGLMAGLAVAVAPIRYGLGIGLAAAGDKLPWRLGRFLDWACAAGLLRVAGAAYQFRHLELQSWLAEQRPPGVAEGEAARQKV